jgi:hypothetical protein
MKTIDIKCVKQWISKEINDPAHEYVNMLIICPNYRSYVTAFDCQRTLYSKFGFKMNVDVHVTRIF